MTILYLVFGVKSALADLHSWIYCVNFAKKNFMNIPYYKSIMPIQTQYHTGEQPVLVVCSDAHEYICKYKRSFGSAYKLACELAGAILAEAWGLNIPSIALVQILPEHWTPRHTINLSAPALGSGFVESVIDVTSLNNSKLQVSEELKTQILEIALFDLWVANEDRNWNNANLLYDMFSKRLVVIDHGCIFNTATFDFPLSLLTENESILYSDFAHSITDQFMSGEKEILLRTIKDKFFSLKKQEVDIVSKIVENMPDSWNMDPNAVKTKITELFDKVWMEKCWSTFVEYANENSYGKFTV